MLTSTMHMSAYEVIELVRAKIITKAEARKLLFVEEKEGE